MVGRRRDEELDEEIRAHLALATQERIERGSSPEDAAREARRELGNELLIKEVDRALRKGGLLTWLEGLAQDLRWACRRLRKQPGFSAAAAATLALGIGANTAIFSVVNAVLLRPLPYPEPERLVRVWEDPGDNPQNAVNPLNYADIRAQARSFEQLGAFYAENTSLTGHGEPERLVRARVTLELLPALRVEPELGRGFLPEDAALEQGVVLMSHRLWQRRFGGDPGTLGKVVMLDGAAATVVGVMPRGFGFPAQAELWAPMPRNDFDPARVGRGSHYLGVVGRLAADVSLEQARAEVETIFAGLRQQHKLTKWRVRVAGMHDDLVRDARQPLLILLGAVGLLLLVACTNVANLTLARSTTRAREMAIRTALGAGRARLLRQLLGESLLLALIGAALGLLLAQGGVRALQALAPALPRLEELRLDFAVLAYTLAVSAGAALLFGSTPAWQASLTAPAAGLKLTSHSLTPARGAERMRRVLVAAEVALSLVLLVGAGLLMRSFVRLTSVDPGFDPERVASLRLSLPSQRYPDAPAQARFYQSLVERVKALAGVESAAFVSDPPLTGSIGLWENGFHIEGQLEPEPGAGEYAYLRWVTPEYFRTLKIPLRRGRLITEDDRAGKGRVILIDEIFARRHFPGQDPIGRRLVVHWRDRIPREIVGVVGPLHPDSLAAGPAPHMYVPYAQTPLNYGTLLVRSGAEPGAVARAAQREVHALDPDQAVYRVQSMRQVVATSLSDRRFNLVLLASFGIAALALAAIGIHGVTTCLVSERRRESAIRLAMGAKREQVLLLVIGHAAKPALVGVLTGFVAALGLGELLRSQLFHVEPADPATLAGVAICLSCVSLAACLLPALRAASVNPAEALRQD